MAADAEREKLEAELEAMRLRMREAERECAEQTRRATQLKEEVIVRLRLGS